VTVVHQFIHSLVPRDAISNHARCVRSVLVEMGVAGNTYVWESRGTKFRETRPFHSFDSLSSQPGTHALYQLATGSCIAPILRDSPVPLMVNYHNITPSDLFDPWEPHVGAELENGMRQLRELAPRTELAIAVSSYNEEELRSLGYRQTTVVPILFDTAGFDHRADPNLLEKLQKEKRGSVWLFVGRITPNKCQHDLLKAFAFYRQIFDPDAQLYLIGGSSSHAYSQALEQFISTAGLSDSVTIAGSVSDEELSAYYKNADVFVCVSEHEGFCVPLLEAMFHDLPIVAYRAAAVPETLDSAGLLLNDKSPAVFSTAVHRVLDDEALRKQLITAGTTRLAEFSLERTKSEFAAALGKVVKS